MKEGFEDPNVIDLAQKRREREAAAVPETRGALEVAVGILEYSRGHRGEMLQEFAQISGGALSRDEATALFNQERQTHALALMDATLEALASKIKEGMVADPKNYPLLVAAAERYLDYGIR